MLETRSTRLLRSGLSEGRRGPDFSGHRASRNTEVFASAFIRYSRAPPGSPCPGTSVMLWMLRWGVEGVRAMRFHASRRQSGCSANTALCMSGTYVDGMRVSVPRFLATMNKSGLETRRLQRPCVLRAGARSAGTQMVGIEPRRRPGAGCSRGSPDPIAYVDCTKPGRTDPQEGILPVRSAREVRGVRCSPRAA